MSPGLFDLVVDCMFSSVIVFVHSEVTKWEISS